MDDLYRINPKFNNMAIVRRLDASNQDKRDTYDRELENLKNLAPLRKALRASPDALCNVDKAIRDILEILPICDTPKSKEKTIEELAQLVHIKECLVTPRFDLSNIETVIEQKALLSRTTNQSVIASVLEDDNSGSTQGNLAIATSQRDTIKTTQEEANFRAGQEQTVAKTIPELAAVMTTQKKANVVPRGLQHSVAVRTSQGDAAIRTFQDEIPVEIELKAATRFEVLVPSLDCPGVYS